MPCDIALAINYIYISTLDTKLNHDIPWQKASETAELSILDTKLNYGIPGRLQHARA
jgi:hypothetical protein